MNTPILQVFLIQILVISINQVTSYGLPDWINENLTSKELEIISKSFIPFYLEQHLSNNRILKSLSDPCNNHLSEWIKEIKKIKRNPADVANWALLMVDSWGKVPEGLLRGHLAALGDFDECLGIKLDFPENPYTQYCTFKLTPLNLELAKKYNPLPQVALCLPTSCDPDDVNQFATSLFEGLAKPEIANYSCVQDGGRKFTIGAQIMIGIYSILIGLSICASIVDLYLRRIDRKKKPEKSEIEYQIVAGNSPPDSGKLLQILLAFSLYSNILKWSNTKMKDSNLGCIHGIRFLSMAWIVMLHTWVMIGFASTWNVVDTKMAHTHNWTMNTIYNATVSVDTFFTLSGLLLAYNLLGILEKNKGSFNLPKFYLHRYIRLTPMYALLIGFMATLLPHVANGPKRFELDLGAKYCQRNWWQNLLYINNLITYGEGDGMCEDGTWYVTNDMQFFFISPLFIYPLWRWEFWGKILLALGTLASIITPSVIIAQNELSPTVLIYMKDHYAHQQKIYYKPWSRIGPYLIGIWAGFLLFKLKKKPNFRLSWPVALGGWTLSTGTALAIIYAPYRWNDPEMSFGTVEAWVYGGFHRSIWGLVICWVIFACVKGRGGIINEFLSWKAFIPLGRLTYAIYLVSFQTQMAMAIYKGKYPSGYSNFNAVSNFFSEMVLCTLIAFICTILMESPFLQLEKIFLGST